MRIRLLNRSYVLVVFLAFFSIDCSKNDIPEPPQPAPTIASFSPSAAGEGEQVIITGTNFKVIPTNNSVKFNGITATISAATMTQLTVIVPAGVTSGKISVSVNNQTATSSTDFIFLGTVSTLAGSGAMGFVNGTGSAAQFGSAPDLAVDAAGNIYVADATSSFAVRKITPAGVVTTLAGNGINGFADGTGSAARFGVLMGVAVDGSGNVYVADLGNYRIRKISPDGVVTTIGGTGMSGYLDGPAATSQFNLPMGVVADNAGNVYVADAGNNRIRKISGGIVSTIAGDGLAGSLDGAAATARFNNPMKIKIDVAGNLIVLDQSNHRVRKISAAGTVSTIAGTAQFNYPAGLAIDKNGNIYVGDQLNQRIRKISTDGIVTTLAGTGVAGYDDGNTNNAKFHNPNGLDITSTGIIYVADNRNFRIRKITF
jgi:serine/threonine protein kinase, bacterial